MVQQLDTPPVTLPPYKRDRFTWITYLMLGFLCFMMSVLGPLMPFLRAELKMDYTLVSLHFSAYNIGSLLASTLAVQVIRRLSRTITYWGGGLGMSGSALALIIPGNPPTLTLLFIFLMGICGGTLLITIQAVLSDHHGEQRGIALTEANIAASLFAIAAPLTVGGFEQSGLGWRFAIILMAGVSFTIFLVGYATPIPEEAPLNTYRENGGKLPRTFWVYWLIIVFAVSTEVNVTYWGSDFLEKAGGFARSDASLALSVYFFAMLLGRIAGSRFVRTMHTNKLLMIAVIIAALGFPILWLAPIAPLKLFGLFLAGLGIGNFYPITLVAATNTVPGQSNKSSALMSVGAGCASLISPFILGWLADLLTIQKAFSLIMVFILAIMGILYYQLRLKKRHY
jgi:fucose permease